MGPQTVREGIVLGEACYTATATAVTSTAPKTSHQLQKFIRTGRVKGKVRVHNVVRAHRASVCVYFFHREAKGRRHEGSLHFRPEVREL